MIPKRDYIRPAPPPTPTLDLIAAPSFPENDDNSHTGVSNAIADVFLVALVFYTLIAIVFGLGNLHNRRDLLRRYENPRPWHTVGLFFVGWAWPVHCCYVVRDYVREWNRERRWRRRMRRPATVVRRRPVGVDAAQGEGGEVAVDGSTGGGGREGARDAGNDVAGDGGATAVADRGSAGEGTPRDLGSAGAGGENAAAVVNPGAAKDQADKDGGNGGASDGEGAAVVDRGVAKDPVVRDGGNGGKGDEDAAADQSKS